MNRLLASIPVNKLRPDVQEQARRIKGLIDRDGFVTIEKRFCANPLKADRVYTEAGILLFDAKKKHGD